MQRTSDTNGEHMHPPKLQKLSAADFGFNRPMGGAQYLVNTPMAQPHSNPHQQVVQPSPGVIPTPTLGS